MTPYVDTLATPKKQYTHPRASYNRSSQEQAKAQVDATPQRRKRSVAIKSYLKPPTALKPSIAISNLDSSPEDTNVHRTNLALAKQSSSATSIKKAKNISDIIGTTEADIYLTEEGPNTFEPLINPQKDIRQALVSIDSKNW